MEFISEDLLYYCEQHSESESPLLAKLNRDTHAKILMPRMLSGHLQGRLLSMLSQIIRPEFILEIGTYTGYSALCLSEGLSENGRLITIDINDELEEFVKGYIVESGKENNIIQLTGNALEIIPQLDYIFDLVFIDANKEEYSEYYDLIIDKVKPGGILLVDNVLWSGQILKPLEKQDPETKCVSSFNEKIKGDKRVKVMMLPIRDGISIIRKL